MEAEVALRDALPSFSAPAAIAVHSYRADSVGLPGQLPPFLRSGGGTASRAHGIAGHDEASRRAVGFEREATSCTHTESALLLLAACSDEAIVVLLDDARSLEMPESDEAAEELSTLPPPPPRGELLTFALHTAVLIRMHGRGALPAHAGRLLARLVSVRERYPGLSQPP